MIKIKIGNNTERVWVIVSENDSPSKIFNDNGIANPGRMRLNGVAISPDALDRPLSELGAKEGDFLLAVKNEDNA